MKSINSWIELIGADEPQRVIFTANGTDDVVLIFDGRPHGDDETPVNGLLLEQLVPTPPDITIGSQADTLTIASDVRQNGSDLTFTGAGDTLPDAWELRYHLNPTNPADAALDIDGDGLLDAVALDDADGQVGVGGFGGGSQGGGGGAGNDPPSVCRRGGQLGAGLRRRRRDGREGGAGGGQAHADARAALDGLPGCEGPDLAADRVDAEHATRIAAGDRSGRQRGAGLRIEE